MPDRRRHRGPHPEDTIGLADAALPVLRRAVDDLCWLLSRGYAERAARKLVGDRFQLTARQRQAVSRCSCSDSCRRDREQRLVVARQPGGDGAASKAGAPQLVIDGYNVLITVESALAGGAVLVARDGSFRDLASLHGTYRAVAETEPALCLIGETLTASGFEEARWLLDAPVSNSGRLAAHLRELAVRRGWRWTVDLVPDPDPLLAASAAVVASSDSAVLDRCGPWLPLARMVVESRVPGAWIRCLDGSGESSGAGREER